MRAPSASGMDPENLKELPQPVKKFYKGEPLALGITQILIGLITIVSGVVLNGADDYSFYFIYVILMVPYWTAVPYVISGSLSVAAAKNPKSSLVKGMLGMNVVSAVAASIAIVILSMSLDSYPYVCPEYLQEAPSPTCREIAVIPHDIMFGMMVVLLLFSILEFCISLSTAVFGCKAVCHETFTETVVVVYQNAPPNSAVDLPAPGKDVPNP